MTEAVRGGQSKRLMEWARKHVADEATFMISAEVYAGEQRKSFSVSTLDKKDVMRLGTRHHRRDVRHGGPPRPGL